MLNNSAIIKVPPDEDDNAMSCCDETVTFSSSEGEPVFAFARSPKGSYFFPCASATMPSIKKYKTVTTSNPIRQSPAVSSVLCDGRVGVGSGPGGGGGP